MTMSRRSSRNGRDLLVRPPCGSNAHRSWIALVVDPIQQLEELAHLRHRGILTSEEFDEQKAKVLDQ
jgi:hypothetical protein